MRSINLTPEKNATRSIGVYVDDNYKKLGVELSEFISSYVDVTRDQWLDFDRLVEESTVFMFVRNPYSRLVSSFIHVCLSGDYLQWYPKWYFKLPIDKDNQLECFKNFCKDFAKTGVDNQHVKLQTKTIDDHVTLGLPKIDNFSIIPYIENKKIFIGKVDGNGGIEKNIDKLSSLIFDSNPPVKFDTWIGNNTHIKFSADYRDWYDDELYNLITPIFEEELRIFDYGF